ncbi:hypothetical protein AAMO2058_000307700 [Amorphochlora amoebiformis]
MAAGTAPIKPRLVASWRSRAAYTLLLALATMMVLAMSLGSPILLHGGDGETVRVPEIRKACPLGTTKECTASEDKIQGFLPTVLRVRGGMREKWKKKRRRRMKRKRRMERRRAGK